MIAAPLWWQERAVLAFNEEDMPGLKEGSKLKQGTLLRLPQIHVTKSEDETCTSIADRFGKNEIWPDRTSFDGQEVLEWQKKVRSTLSTLSHHPFVHLTSCSLTLLLPLPLPPNSYP